MKRMAMWLGIILAVFALSACMEWPGSSDDKKTSESEQTQAESAAPEEEEVTGVAVVEEEDDLDATDTMHGDWRVTCVEGEQGERCLLSQVQTTGDSGQRALAIELQPVAANGKDDSQGKGDAKSQGARLSGVMALPFGLSLQSGIQLSVDDGKAQDLPFSTCIPNGCLVPLTFDAQAVAKLRNAKAMQVKAKVVANGQDVTLSVPLKGFGDALDDALAGGSEEEAPPA